jgi:hypothetical protein
MNATFECEDCIGMASQGCYCAAMGASRPGGPIPDEEPYPGYAPCPACYESCGFNGYWRTSWDDPGSFQEDHNDPCPECNGTGSVECEPVTLEDIALSDHDQKMIETAWDDYQSAARMREPR